MTVVKSLLGEEKKISAHTVGLEGRECSGCYRRRSAHMPTTRGRQPLEVAQSQIRAIPAPASSQSAAEKHRQADFAIDKHNAEAVLDRLNVPRGHDTVHDDSEEQAEGEHSCVIVGMIQFASFLFDLGDLHFSDCDDL